MRELWKNHEAIRAHVVRDFADEEMVSREYLGRLRAAAEEVERLRAELAKAEAETQPECYDIGAL